MTLDMRLRRLELSQQAPDCLTCAAPTIIRFYTPGDPPLLPLDTCLVCGRPLSATHGEVFLPENERRDTWNDG